jgi:hypothetical protein
VMVVLFCQKTVKRITKVIPVKQNKISREWSFKVLTFVV